MRERYVSGAARAGAASGRLKLAGNILTRPPRARPLSVVARVRGCQYARGARARLARASDCARGCDKRPPTISSNCAVPATERAIHPEDAGAACKTGLAISGVEGACIFWRARASDPGTARAAHSPCRPTQRDTTSTCTLCCALVGRWCRELVARHIHVRETARPAPRLHASMWCRPRSNFNRLPRRRGDDETGPHKSTLSTPSAV